MHPLFTYIRSLLVSLFFCECVCVCELRPERPLCFSTLQRTSHWERVSEREPQNATRTELAHTHTRTEQVCEKERERETNGKNHSSSQANIQTKREKKERKKYNVCVHEVSTRQQDTQSLIHPLRVRGEWHSHRWTWRRTQAWICWPLHSTTYTQNSMRICELIKHIYTTKSERRERRRKNMSDASLLIKVSVYFYDTLCVLRVVAKKLFHWCLDGAWDWW